MQTPATHDASLVAGAGQRFESARRLSFFSRFAGKTPEYKGASAPRVRLAYCNPPQKHIVARGRAEEWAVFCVVSVSVSGPHEAPAPGERSSYGCLAVGGILVLGWVVAAPKQRIASRLLGVPVIGAIHRSKKFLSSFEAPA